MKKNILGKTFLLFIILLSVARATSQVYRPAKSSEKVKETNEKKTTKKAPSTEKTNKSSLGSKVMTILLITPNMDCNISIDGENIGQANANTPFKYNVENGEHLISCTSLDSKDLLQQTISVISSSQKIIQVDLLTVKNNRENNEKKVKENAEKEQKLAATKKLITELNKHYSSVELNKLREYILDGADVNSINKDGETALMFAVFFNSFDLVKFLIQRNADVNMKITDGRNLLTVAIDGNSSRDLCNFLITSGVSVNSKDNEGWIPLHHAASLKKWELANLLIEKGSNANERANDGRTSLHLAVEQNSIEIVRLLLKNGADPNIKNNDGFPPIAFQNISRDIYNVLISYGAK